MQKLGKNRGTPETAKQRKLLTASWTPEPSGTGTAIDASTLVAIQGHRTLNHSFDLREAGRNETVPLHRICVSGMPERIPHSLAG